MIETETEREKRKAVQVFKLSYLLNFPLNIFKPILYYLFHAICNLASCQQSNHQIRSPNPNLRVSSVTHTWVMSFSFFHFYACLMLLCGLSRGQACWDTRAVRHNCEVKKTNAICMTEIIAQCQVPPPPTSLSLSNTLSFISPSRITSFLFNFSSTDKVKNQVTHTVGETRLCSWQSWKTIDSNSISNAARVVRLAGPV